MCVHVHATSHTPPPPVRDEWFSGESQLSECFFGFNSNGLSHHLWSKRSHRSRALVSMVTSTDSPTNTRTVQKRLVSPMWLFALHPALMLPDTWEHLPASISCFPPFSSLLSKISLRHVNRLWIGRVCLKQTVFIASTKPVLCVCICLYLRDVV